MSRLEAFRELQAHLQEAVTVLGHRRVALGAGCCVTSIEGWLRRKDVLLQTSTLERVLPRLRRWETWIGSYTEEQMEISRLMAAPEVDWWDHTAELHRRLRLALQSHSISQIALGCEVGERLVMLWCLGSFPERYKLETVQALGHLRHVGTWPALRGEAPEPVEQPA